MWELSVHEDSYAEDEAALIIGLGNNRVRTGVRTSMAVLSLISLAACADSADERSLGTGSAPSPAYFVEGARPSPGAEDSEDDEGCVPYSGQRPDVHICGRGDLPDSWKPAPPPGDYSDYPAACDAAARIVDDRADELMSVYELSTPPIIDVQSCGAGGLGSEEEDRWRARFGLVNSDDVPPYQSVTVTSFTLDAGDRPSPVRLSESRWPAECQQTAAC
jgi:hypothetical protein